LASYNHETIKQAPVDPVDQCCPNRDLRVTCCPLADSKWPAQARQIFAIYFKTKQKTHVAHHVTI